MGAALITMVTGIKFVWVGENVVKVSWDPALIKTSWGTRLLGVEPPTTSKTEFHIKTHGSDMHV